MSIPKVIHYCWFGGQAKPGSVEKCIKSWKRKCRDYQIVEWNEDNFDLHSNAYVREAYAEKKWAFVTDYVRLAVVCQYGGIYLDTDIEVLKDFDRLLQYKAFFGFEDGNHVNTGAGFGAEPGNPLLKELLDVYETLHFLDEDGCPDTTTCPVHLLPVFLRHGLEQNGKTQILEPDILILAPEYLSPKDFWSGRTTITGNTLSIHHFDASWKSREERQFLSEQRIRSRYGKLGEKLYRHIFARILDWRK